MKFLPAEVNVLGKKYEIIYCDNPIDVDIAGRKSLFGSTDFWERKIRVYSKQTGEDMVDTVIHEILHIIDNDLNIRWNESDSEDSITLLALGLADVLMRNNWLCEI